MKKSPEIFKRQENSYIGKIGIGKYKKYVNPKLTLRTTILYFFFIVAFVLGLVKIIWSGGHLVYAVVACFAGLGLGLLIGRVSKIVWHQSEENVIAKLDLSGILILLVYSVFAIFRKRLFAEIISVENLTVSLLWFSIGTMMGRIIIFHKMIMRRIKEDKFNG